MKAAAYQQVAQVSLPPRASEAESLREVIERIAPECATPEEAEDLALAHLQGDAELSEQAMRVGLRQIIGEMRTRLRTAMIRERRAEWKAPQIAQTRFTRSMVARSSFFDWPLPNSALTLGDATVADLEQAAAFHDSHRDAHANRGAAYRQIAALLSSNRRAATVRGAIPENELGLILAGEPK